MGCWNETCMLTHLPILVGERTVAVLIAQQHATHNSNCYPDGVFQPISLPITGDYDDYGGLENIERNAAVLLGLSETELYSSHDSTACSFTPVATADMQTAPDWEQRLSDLIEEARHDTLFIKDPTTVTGFSRVFVVMMKDEFVTFARRAAKQRESLRYGDSITYLLSLPPNLRPAVREKRLSKKDVQPLMWLNCFMNDMRIAWHPTCGSGSQNTLDEPFQRRFYRKMADYAKRIACPDDL